MLLPAAALTYLFATEDGVETREKLADTIKERFPEAGELLTTFKDKFMDNLTGLKSQAEDVIS